MENITNPIDGAPDVAAAEEVLVRSVSIEQAGGESSRAAGGNSTTLRLHLNRIYQQQVENAGNQEAEKNRRSDALRLQMTGLEGHNDTIRVDITHKKQAKTGFITQKENLENERKQKEDTQKKDIQRHEREITLLQAGDATPLLRGGSGAGTKLAFYLAAGILGALTIYLILFYISIIHGAFILDVKSAILAALKAGKNFEPVIINVEALPDTFNKHGILGVLFVSIATSLFLALGYLIHRFNEEKAVIKAISIYLFTFVFDGFLAYTIVRNIYSANVSTGTPGYTKPWEGIMAFYSTDFYIILMAGFAVYIIWGIILEFAIKEYDKMDELNIGIKDREQRIIHCNEVIETTNKEYDEKMTNKQNEIDETQKLIDALNLKIEDNLTAIAGKQRELDSLPHRIFINWADFENKVSHFVIGWLNWITNPMSHLPTSLVSECNQVKDNFLETLRTNFIALT